MLAALSDGDKAVIGAFFALIVAPTWMAWWNARIARKQVTANGGSSLKDQVTKMAHEQDLQGIKVDTLVAVQELHTAQINTITSNQGKTNTQIIRERAISNDDDHTIHDLPVRREA